MKSELLAEIRELMDQGTSLEALREFFWKHRGICGQDLKRYLLEINKQDGTSSLAVPTAKPSRQADNKPMSKAGTNKKICPKHRAYRPCVACKAIAWKLKYGKKVMQG